MKKNNVVWLLISLLFALLGTAFWGAAFYAKGTVHLYIKFAYQFFLILSFLMLFKFVYSRLKQHLPNSKQLFWRTLHRMMKWIQKEIQKTNLAAARFMNRHGIRMTRYQDQIETLIVSESKKSRHRFRSVRWRDAKTEDDKVRYLYIHYIQKAIRKGFRFQATDTPNEIHTVFSKIEALSNEQLFLLYNRARYASPSGITPDEVQSLMVSVGHKHR